MSTWQPIKVDPRYDVSVEGRVRRMRPNGDYRTLVASQVKCGYLIVNVGGKSRYVHRLVAEAFLPNPEGRRTVNHKNLDKTDNRLENLEWATDSENSLHARETYGNYNVRGSKVGRAKLTEEQVAEIKRLMADGVSQRKIAKIFNISRGPVSGISLGILWTHVK